MTDRFLAMLAHDLRDPLQRARGWADGLEGPAGDKVRASLADMQHIIDDVLALARTGTSPAAHDLAVLVDAVRPRLPDAVIQVTPGTWYVDHTAGLHILQNLLANAIHHAPGAPIQVRSGQHDGASWLEVHNEAPAQADPGRRHGLGLPIVAHLVSLHGGTLDEAPDGPGHKIRISTPMDAMK